MGVTLEEILIRPEIKPEETEPVSIQPKRDLKSQNLYYVDSDQFDIGNAKKGGGVNKSLAVKKKDDPNGPLYQLKKSISNSSFFRRLKSFGTDREILGEFIASTVSTSIDPKSAPHVALVKTLPGQIHIASQHLENSLKIGDKKIKVDVSENKQALARAIALSALHGDHDINPENLHIIANGDIARIDFGHAFHDLIRFQEPTLENRIIDFFNREQVDHAPLKDGQSKLWRHYTDGLIPSDEMAIALKELSQCNPSQGFEVSKAAFLQITDKKTQKHIRKSLEAIAKTLGTHRIANKDVSYKDFLDIFFKLTLEPFYRKNLADMKSAAETMRLQFNIDQAIQAKENSQKILKTLAEQNPQTIQWIKTNAGQKAFKGTFNEYVNERRKYYRERSDQTIKT